MVFIRNGLDIEISVKLFRGFFLNVWELVKALKNLVIAKNHPFIVNQNILLVIFDCICMR